ncbi:MAG TPA: signal peptidase I [Solirubrobacteraceae bacterium]|nr:signal peptidase I [Solirubrobacteraceae bacterium]
MLRHGLQTQRSGGLRRRPGAKLELVMLVAGTIFFALAIQAFAVKPYVIPSPSMLPTLKPGQRVLVDRFSHTVGSDPKLGDITVFHPPSGAEVAFSGECGAPGEGPSYFHGALTGRSCSRPTATHSDKTYIKRVVGLPGDRIEVRDGHVVRNGLAAKEPFASACDGRGCNLGEIVVPASSYFLMGDNRPNSNDGRFWGPVPREWIIGKAVATYWPPNRIGSP